MDKPPRLSAQSREQAGPPTQRDGFELLHWMALLLALSMISGVSYVYWMSGVALAPL